MGKNRIVSWISNKEGKIFETETVSYKYTITDNGRWLKIPEPPRQWLPQVGDVLTTKAGEHVIYKERSAVGEGIIGQSPTGKRRMYELAEFPTEVLFEKITTKDPRYLEAISPDEDMKRMKRNRTIGQKLDDLIERVQEWMNFKRY